MSVTYLELIGLNIQDTPDSFPVGHWDGYAPAPITQNFVQGQGIGLTSTWGVIPLTATVGALSSVPYIGYDTNFGAAPEPVVILFVNGSYVGYDTNFGATPYNNVLEVSVVDIDSVIEFPKNQFVYFKMKGFNPQTHTYENWIIKEDITSRPELFDPGRNPPSVDRDVFRTPPSGHALTNITIVGRWIQ